MIGESNALRERSRGAFSLGLGVMCGWGGSGAALRAEPVRSAPACLGQKIYRTTATGWSGRSGCGMRRRPAQSASRSSLSRTV